MNHEKVYVICENMCLEEGMTKEQIESALATEEVALNAKANSADLTSHVNNKSNPHGVTKAQIGLGNVNNTSDANKPISTAVQTALNGKSDTNHNHDSRYYTETEVNNLLNAKQKTITSGTAAPSGGNNGDIYIQY